MSVTQRYADVSDAIRRLGDECKGVVSDLISRCGRIRDAESLAKADLDEVMYRATRLCELKAEAEALLARKQELSDAMRREGRI